MKLNFIDGIIVRNRDGLMSGKKETMTVENGMIISFGKEEKDGKVISLKGKWVFPGLINTHGHAGMTLLRGLSDDVPLEVWLSRDIWPAEAKLTKASIITATQLAMVEMIKSGTTTFLD
ncbi:MAG TPA: amidohydrolase family protein, partial [Massilibacterium sp.]|nr:amidohydrolase family protein [Massilibacterium sp.]